MPFAKERQGKGDGEGNREGSGAEVDFITDDLAAAIDAKSSPAVHAGHLRGLRELARDHAHVKRRIVVSLDPAPRRTDDGIEILPYRVFTERLWAGDLIG